MLTLFGRARRVERHDDVALVGGDRRRVLLGRGRSPARRARRTWASPQCTAKPACGRPAPVPVTAAAAVARRRPSRSARRPARWRWRNWRNFCSVLEQLGAGLGHERLHLGLGRGQRRSPPGRRVILPALTARAASLSTWARIALSMPGALAPAMSSTDLPASSWLRTEATLWPVCVASSASARWMHCVPPAPAAPRFGLAPAAGAGRFAGAVARPAPLCRAGWRRRSRCRPRQHPPR